MIFNIIRIYKNAINYHQGKVDTLKERLRKEGYEQPVKCNICGWVGKPSTLGCNTSGVEFCPKCYAPTVHEIDDGKLCECCYKKEYTALYYSSETTEERCCADCLSKKSLIF